jgi:hypothetical protein
MLRNTGLKYLSIACLWLVASLCIAQPRQFTLSADDWARPRDGETITGFQTLRDLVVVWSANGGEDMIEVRYPGGDEGDLWARELADWLVALGVPSSSIQLMPGNARADQISLLIVESRQSRQSVSSQTETP